jgi:hypothetical protein
MGHKYSLVNQKSNLLESFFWEVFMLKLMKKIVPAVLAVSVTFSTLPAFASATIDSASSAPVLVPSNNTGTETVVQPQWKGKIAKEVLEKLYKALNDRSNIESIKSGMRAVGLGKHTGKIDTAVSYMKQEIKWLLDWQEVTTQNLKDKLAGALYDAGLPLSAARITAGIVIELLL